MIKTCKWKDGKQLLGFITTKSRIIKRPLKLETSNWKVPFLSTELPYKGISKKISILHNIFSVTYLIWKSTRLQITFDLVEYIINE